MVYLFDYNPEQEIYNGRGIEYRRINVNDSTLSITYENQGIEYDSFDALPKDIRDIIVKIQYEDPILGEIFFYGGFMVKHYEINEESYVSITEEALDLSNTKIENHIQVTLGCYNEDYLMENVEFDFNTLESLAEKNYGRIHNAELVYYLDEECSQEADITDATLKKLYIKVKINDTFMDSVCQVALISGKKLSSFDGTQKVNEGWIDTSSQTTKANKYDGGDCAPENPDAVNVRAFTIGDTLTTDVFEESNYVIITALCGSNSSGKDMFFTVELLDASGNVVAVKADIFATTNKTSKETVIVIKSDVPFVQIRFTDFYPGGSNKRMGIVRIDVIVDFIKE